MLSTLSSNLHKLKKSKLYREAYLYQLTKKTFQNFIAENFHEQEFDISVLDSTISLKEQKNLIEITIRITNATFSSWLKMNLLTLEEGFKAEFLIKNLTNKNTTIKIKLGNKK